MMLVKYLTQLQLILLVTASAALAQQPQQRNADNKTAMLQLEKLTSTEVQDRLVRGTDTMLIPIGGTEQSGPYVVLGKHNFRVQYLAEKIADQLGNTLVAPVISYVPEGAIHPPMAHMRFAGTISISDAAFNGMLEGAARSFKQHGFHTIIFLGDHGGYQKNIEQVVQKLNREWSKESGKNQRTRVIALTEYYRLSSSGFAALLKNQGFKETEIGAHAGLADTALMLAADKNGVRSEAMMHNRKPVARDGVTGDPQLATPKLGQLGVKLIIDGSVAAIRAALQTR